MSHPRRSFRSSSSVALVAALAAGCGYGSGDDEGIGPDDGYQPAACGELEEAAIDSGEALEIEPGAGAGAFIEYEPGGIYRITTSCDVNEGGACAWDIVVSPRDGGGILSLAPDSIEQDDSVATDGENVQLLASTEDDLDGFTLHTAPGSALRFDALLDGGCANRYVFWVGDGALHSGAPSNPIDLVPSED